MENNLREKKHRGGPMSEHSGLIIKASMRHFSTFFPFVPLLKKPSQRVLCFIWTRILFCLSCCTSSSYFFGATRNPQVCSSAVFQKRSKSVEIMYEVPSYFILLLFFCFVFFLSNFFFFCFSCYVELIQSIIRFLVKLKKVYLAFFIYLANYNK